MSASFMMKAFALVLGEPDQPDGESQHACANFSSELVRRAKPLSVSSAARLSAPPSGGEFSEAVVQACAAY